MEIVRDRLFSSIRQSLIEIEYDKDTYSIEHVINSGLIILRRLKDNTIVKVFNDSLNFLVQHNEEDMVHFIVEDYSMCISDIREYPKLLHYVDRGLSSLELINSFKFDGSRLDQCRYGKTSFVVEQEGYGGKIYNLQHTSERFDRVYSQKSVKEYFGENIILVSKVCYEYTNPDIKDRITFGIDAKTFEIVTPIWSEYQKRLIQLYTKEQIDEICEKTGSFNSLTPGEFTIFREVRKFLRAKGEECRRTDNVFDECYPSDTKLNEEFVKKFVLK